MEGVQFRVWGKEGEVIERLAIRVFLTAAQVGQRTLVAVLYGVGQSVSPTDPSTLEEDEKFITLGARLKVQGSRRAI